MLGLGQLLTGGSRTDCPDRSSWNLGELWRWAVAGKMEPTKVAELWATGDLNDPLLPIFYFSWDIG